MSSSYKDMGYNLSDLPFENENGCSLGLPGGFWCSSHVMFNGKLVHLACNTDEIILNASYTVKIPEVSHEQSKR